MIRLESFAPLPRNIDDILRGEDEFGLLADVKPSKQHPSTDSANDPVVANFLAVVDFVKREGREPDMAVPAERSLARRLEKYRKDEELQAKVRTFDEPGLLTVKIADPSKCDVQEVRTRQGPDSLDEVFASDTLGLLDDINYDIFNLKHVDAVEMSERDVPDVIGRQRACADFWKYETAFSELYRKLDEGKVIKTPFKKESTIRPGQFFQLRGQLCFVAARLNDGDYKGRENPRLLVIFANKTEIEILKLSMARALYADKHSRWFDTGPHLESDDPAATQPEKHLSGFIYIVETESKAPELAELKLDRNLVKVGFTERNPRERLRNASKDRTYLCAPVKLRYTVECYDLHTPNFEKLIHTVLHNRRLAVTLIDHNGKQYHPEEWFMVSAETALEVAKRIIDGTIGQYYLDSASGRLRVRTGTKQVADAKQ